jgi:hypothetical protein
MNNCRCLHEPEQYQIVVKGNLDPKWTDWFDGFTICQGESGKCTLIGEVPDQSALHGMLAKIRDLGLPILMVKKLEGDEEKD